MTARADQHRRRRNEEISHFANPFLSMRHDHAGTELPRWKIRSVPANVHVWRGSPPANCSRKSARACRCAGPPASAARRARSCPRKTVAASIARGLSQHHLSEQDPDHRHRGTGLARQPGFASALGDDRKGDGFHPTALIVTKDQAVPADLRDAANESGTPVWISAQRGHELLTYRNTTSRACSRGA